MVNGYKALGTRELPKSIADKINKYGNDTLRASGLVTWVKVTSGAGLTIVSNPNIPTFGMKSIHGTFDSAAPIGLRGYGTSNSDTFDGISGIGYKPRPIIESVEIKNGKRGLSKKATIKVKCFTIDQLEQIAKYFNEPGFTLAVEWGWNIDAALSTIKTNVAGLAGINNDTDRESDAKKSNYDYDNFLGNITGGGMTINDGTFDLTIEATGLGELALNLQQNQQSICNEEEPEEPGIGRTIINALKGIGINIWTSINNIWELITSTNWDKNPFLHMYGDLPSEYQVEAVKKLSAFGNGVGDYQNFVGFNKEAKEKTYGYGRVGKLLRSLGFEVGHPQMGKAELEEELLLDEERFIRFGSLIKILETANVLKIEDGITLAGGKKLSLDINTKNVPITAFPRIFSTNKSKLLILNDKTPDFGLVDAFELPDRNDASIYVFFGNGTPNGSPGATDAKIVNTLYPTQNRQIRNNGVFVRPDPLKSGNIDIPGLAYGYLEDLYINFDFAVDIIKKEGILKKDAILEMLNGMSSAVNNLWDFQIVEDTDDEGNKILTVADMNFVGFRTDIEWPVFSSFGVNSPFKSFSLDIDIPSAMKNQIIAKRLTKGKINVNQSMPRVPPSLWSTEGEIKDLIMVAMAANIPDICKPAEIKETKTTDGVLNKNAEEFAKKAGIFLKPRDPSKVDGDLINLAKKGDIYVGTYNDSAIFNDVKEHNYQFALGEVLTSKPGILLPITVTFTILGTGGIEFGHSFRISDIFKKYTDGGVFQVREVSHKLNGSSWETTVEAQFRPIPTLKK